MQIIRELIIMEELRRLNVELTSACNYACVSCPTHSLIRGKGVMSLELLKAIFDEVGNDLDRIFLWGYGEPLLHPDISEILKYANRFSVKKVLSTTGWMIENLKEPESLCQLDELIISINGLTKESYAKHQINGDLEKVLRGIKKISPIMHNSKTRFIMQMVVHKGNLGDIPEAKYFANKYGFDMLVLKSFNVMDKKQETFDEFVPLGTKFSRYKHKLDEFNVISDNRKYPCQDWMVVNWDGSVNPCCWDYTGKYNLGNVGKEGVYKVWNGFTALNHRNLIKKRNFLDICINCADSKIVNSYSFTVKGSDDVNKSI